MENDHPEIAMDVSGLLCPLPVLKARKRLNAMPPGAVLVVTATDPMSAIDIPHFCNEQGHALEQQSQTGTTFTFRIRRK
ncbi:MAG: sulfurtransferase TusA family protein [Alphaproteobacteria bacterium]|nr:sulfurtransferase TusA family protein [Alphaproteobacteria bacterium]